MAYIELPDWVSPRNATPSLLDYGITAEPVLGGASVRVNRPGGKFEVSFELPPLRSYDEARIVRSRLMQGKTTALRVKFPTNGFRSRVGGSPLVDGAGQEGTTLNLKGLTANSVIHEGQFVTVTKGDANYLHMSTSDATVASDGTVSLTIEPELRAVTDNDATCELSEPYIEGYVSGPEFTWREDVSQYAALSFTVRERW